MGIGGDGLYLPQGFFVFFFCHFRLEGGAESGTLDCAEETNSAVWGFSILASRP